jgi:hypothetical protein
VRGDGSGAERLREEKEVMSMLAERSGCARRARGVGRPGAGVGLVGRVYGEVGSLRRGEGRKDGTYWERRLAR